MKTAIVLICMFIVFATIVGQSEGSRTKAAVDFVGKIIQEIRDIPLPSTDEVLTFLCRSSKANVKSVEFLKEDSPLIYAFFFCWGNEFTKLKKDFLRRVEEGDSPLVAFQAAQLRKGNWEQNPLALKEEANDPFIPVPVPTVPKPGDPVPQQPIKKYTTTTQAPAP